MEGDSEKQVAVRLSFSPYTVHDYVKLLHTRFGVRSRGELLARCRAFWPVLAAGREIDDSSGNG
jgi:DNA-binding CsgD family transcriptional regulator